MLAGGQVEGGVAVGGGVGRPVAVPVLLDPVPEGDVVDAGPAVEQVHVCVLLTPLSPMSVSSHSLSPGVAGGGCECRLSCSGYCHSPHSPPRPGPRVPPPGPGSGEAAHSLIRTQEHRTLKMTAWIMDHQLINSQNQNSVNFHRILILDFKGPAFIFSSTNLIQHLSSLGGL